MKKKSVNKVKNISFINHLLWSKQGRGALLIVNGVLYKVYRRYKKTKKIFKDFYKTL